MSSQRPLACGDIVLVDFPFSDHPGAKTRPALVIGLSSGRDVILAFITGNIREIDARADVQVLSTNAEFASTGLARSSLIRLDRVATADRRRIQARIGRIGVQTSTAVQEALRYVLNL